MGKWENYVKFIFVNTKCTEMQLYFILGKWRWKTISEKVAIPEECVPNANFTGDNVQHLFGYKQQERICAEYKDSGIYPCVASQGLL